MGKPPPNYSLAESLDPVIAAALGGALILPMNAEILIALIRSAEESAENVVSNGSHLPKNEIAAIIIYTNESPEREESLYYVVNAALRCRDRAKLKPFIQYIWLLMHALKKVAS